MSTSLEVAYAASRLARHNSKLGASHHKVADRVLHYLKKMRLCALELDGSRAMTAEGFG